MNQLLANAVETVPPGAWAVGVSGGADSVALLTLLRLRADLSLHVVHLNHQLRASESDEDAEFVTQLAARYGLPCTIENRSSTETTLPKLPRNPSARYRRLRLALFEHAVRQHKLNGVLLAHHADDQAETILHRLLRGSGYLGLAGMSASAVIGGLHCFRPLLHVRHETLREWLRDCNQPWREDASNQSPKYLRNRLRRMLGDDPSLSSTLLELGATCASLRDWVAFQTPAAGLVLAVKDIGDLPSILARAAARNWLLAGGVSAGKIQPETVDRLLAMCIDASTSPRVQFPCGVVVGRRRGMIEKVGIKSEIRNLSSALRLRLEEKSEANPKTQIPMSKPKRGQSFGH